MVCRGTKGDPRSDPAAAYVMAAYQAAGQAGLPTPRCYRAGVEAWRRAHPDHTAVYVARQADGSLLTTLAEETRNYLAEKIEGMSAEEAAVTAFLRVRLGELTEQSASSREAA